MKKNFYSILLTSAFSISTVTISLTLTGASFLFPQSATTQQIRPEHGWTSMQLSISQPITQLPVQQANVTYLEQQRGPSGNEAQRWRLSSVGNGIYLIENVRLSREQGIPVVLDYDYKQGNVTYLEQQRGPSGNEAQRWRLSSVGNGIYLIENARLSREQGIPMILDYRN